MSRRVFVLSVLILFFSFLGSSQDLWYFGQNAGLHFLSSAVPLTNSAMNTPEGCAVADNGGSLLFYTNGQTVWNAQHNIMTNGGGLNGNPLSTQSAVIVRTEGQNKYYIFTVDNLAGAKGLSYSRVDMTLGASGQIDEKNVFLQANMTEKLTVIEHCNKRDAWVVGHEWGTHRFFAWLVTKNGVDPNPVISSVGSVHSGNVFNNRGYLKVNREFDRLALCVQDEGFAELFDFDNTFGIVSNPLTISNLPNAYGVEFSFNGKVLYVTTTTGYLYQFSLSNYTSSSVNASRIQLTISNSLLGALQRGPDQRIYVAQDLSYFLGVIDIPDSYGPACAFNPQGVYLGGRKSEAGLPPILNFVQEPSLTINEPCAGDTSFFDPFTPYLLDSLIWFFGDSLNTPFDTSTMVNAHYIYPKAGAYMVTLILYRCNSSDTLQKLAQVKDKPNPNLGPDASICDNITYVLSPGAGSSYLWSTGSVASSITVNQVGTYWVQVSNPCGTRSDTVEIESIFPSPIFSLGNDTLMCKGDTLTLCFPDSLGDFLWVNGDTMPCMSFYASGNYQLTITNEFGCSNFDDKLIEFLDIPLVHLGNDTSICLGQTLLLNAGSMGTYSWNNGSTVSDYTVLESGTYAVTVSNKCGSAYSAINVVVDDCEKTIWIPSAFMPEGGGENSIFRVKGLYVSDFELAIFNRYGQLIYQSYDIDEGWDGTYNGKICQIGVYAWTLRYSDHHGKKYKHMGTLTLLR